MTVENEPLLLGLEVGGSKLQLVAAVSPMRIIRRQRLPVNRGAGAAAIQGHIKTALTKWAGTRWRAMGVGFGGPVDWWSGRICCSPQVDGWDDVDLHGWLVDLIEAPFAVGERFQPGRAVGSPTWRPAGHRRGRRTLQVSRRRADDNSPLALLCLYRTFMKKTLITVSDLEKKEEPVQGKYPKFWMFGGLPAWGFYARQADGIQFRNVRIILWKADVRPAMVLDDVLRVSTDQLSVSSAPHDPVFVMQDVRNASFKRLDFPTSQRGAIKMQGNCEKTEGLQ